MLQTREGDVSASLLQFAGIVAATAGVGFATSYLNGTLALRWRAWLTEDYTNRWLAWRRYYRIERNDVIDNPDQRIAEDIQLLTPAVLGLLLGFTLSVVSLYQFTALLMTLSDPIRADVFGQTIVLPGDMVIWGNLLRHHLVGHHRVCCPSNRVAHDGAATLRSRLPV